MQDRLDAPKPHLTHFGGLNYDVRKLEAIAQSLPDKTFDLADSRSLEPIIEGKYWKDTEGASIGPSDLISAFHENGRNWQQVLAGHPTWSEHVAKLRRVSYATPVLVYKGHVIDGIHRLTKALCDGVEGIPFKELDELPAAAIHAD
jgi:hypothetical protein